MRVLLLRGGGEGSVFIAARSGSISLGLDPESKIRDPRESDVICLNGYMEHGRTAYLYRVLTVVGVAQHGREFISVDMATLTSGHLILRRVAPSTPLPN